MSSSSLFNPLRVEFKHFLCNFHKRLPNWNVILVDNTKSMPVSWHRYYKAVEWSYIMWTDQPFAQKVNLIHCCCCHTYTCCLEHVWMCECMWKHSETTIDMDLHGAYNANYTVYICVVCVCELVHVWMHETSDTPTQETYIDAVVKSGELISVNRSPAIK